MIERPRVRLAAYYFFAYGASGALFPILSLVLSARGLPASDIGAVIMVNALAGVLVPPLWGFAADRFHIREKLLRIVSAGSALGVLLLLLPKTLPEYLLAMATFCCFRSAISSLVDTTTYATLGADRARFGSIRAWGSLSFAICAGLAGWFRASRHGDAVVIATSMIFAASTLFSPKVATAPPSAPRPAVKVGDAIALVMRSGLVWVFAGHVFYYGAHSVFDAFFALFVKEIGQDELFGSIGWTIAVLSEVTLMFFARRLIADRDPAKIMVITGAIAAFRWFATAVVVHPLALLALQSLHAFTFGLWYLAGVAYTQSKVPDELRTSVQAMSLGAVAIGATIGCLGGGQILEHLGGRALFAAAGVMSLFGLALYAWARRDREDLMRARRHRRRFIAAAVLALAALFLAPMVFPGATFRVAMSIERSLARLDEKDVQVGPYAIRYLEGGPSDAPVVLLVHGFGGDKDNWTRMARSLTKDYHVVIPDLPGFGQSTQIESASYDVRAQAARIDAFGRALHLPPQHVAGNSMGGHIAGAYTIMFPEQVKSVAFIDNAGITSPKESEMQARLAHGENPLLVEDYEQYQSMMTMIFVKKPWAPEPVYRYFAEQAIAHEKFNAKVWKDLQDVPFPLEPELEQIQKPVMILWGDHDRLRDVSSVDVMKAKMPLAKVTILKDVGHLPMLERPSESADAYLEFLRSTADSSPPGRADGPSRSTPPPSE